MTVMLPQDLRLPVQIYEIMLCNANEDAMSNLNNTTGYPPLAVFISPLNKLCIETYQLVIEMHHCIQHTNYTLQPNDHVAARLLNNFISKCALETYILGY